jgi:hypothetical protein
MRLFLPPLKRKPPKPTAPYHAGCASAKIDIDFMFSFMITDLPVRGKVARAVNRSAHDSLDHDAENRAPVFGPHDGPTC